MNVSLIWVTPNAEQMVGKIARVSNPSNQNNTDVARLLAYCIRNQHWSIFEMVNACVEINTTRDIGRQILRHRSFTFQEFSQRYADVTYFPEAEPRETRLQDTKNRQSSLDTNDLSLKQWWGDVQHQTYATAMGHYQEALEKGIAKEQARALLPEGLTPTRMYMSGTLRSWIHYINLRTGPETQKEHREVAQACEDVLKPVFPTVWEALRT